jgi:hypothetical protein
MHETAKLFDNDTLFQAASISKAMTALAVIKLCQEGKLDLDAPISQYLNSEQISWISTAKTFALVSQISCPTPPASEFMVSKVTQQLTYRTFLKYFAVIHQPTTSKFPSLLFLV